MSIGQRVITGVLGLGSGQRDPLLVLYRRQRLWRAAGRGEQVALILSKPWRAWKDARQFVQSHGDAVRRRYGAGTVRQLLQFSWISFRYSAAPSPVSAHWAFEVHRPRKWDAWFSAEHCTLILSDLANRASPELRERISDKATFAEWAVAAGLPTVPILASFDGGEPVGATIDAVAGVLPPADLFAKPARLTWGSGARRWRHARPGQWTEGNGVLVSGRDVVAAVAEASKANPFLLQPALDSHPSLRRLAPDALCTVRCVTFADEHGQPQILGAAIRFPMAGMVVDNVSAGGMFAGIDEATGRLTRGFRVAEAKLFEPVVTGPDGVTRLDQVVLEQWGAIRELALAAQRAVAPRPSVGWDIGLAPDGPVLVEANIGWSGLTFLLPTERTHADSGFPQALMHHWHATAPEPAARAG